MPSHFKFNLEDFRDHNTFLKAAGRNHINYTVTGEKKPLKTSGSVDPNIQKTLSTWAVSDIMQGTAANRPAGAAYDVFNQSLSSDLTHILQEQGGGINDLLGGRTSFAPDDVVSRGQVFTGGKLESTPGTTNAVVEGAANPGSKKAKDMLVFARKQVGDKYVFGAETDLNDPDPTVFDCSELVQWACHQVGITFPDGSSNQIKACADAGREITVEKAKVTPGAFLWHPGHAAISIGTGNETIEAMGAKYGVLESHIGTRFTRAGLIPGLEY